MDRARNIEKRTERWTREKIIVSTISHIAERGFSIRLGKPFLLVNKERGDSTLVLYKLEV
jgi:hypothetical protein